LAWLHEALNNGHYERERCPTDRMAADIITKHFANAAKWAHACRLISHVKVGVKALPCTPSVPGMHEQGGSLSQLRALKPPLHDPKRTLIEFCCSSSSVLGLYAETHQTNCKIVRITEELDANSPVGLAKAIGACNHSKVLLWVSIPCTGGTVWQRWNRLKPGGEARLQQHWSKFRELWQSFQLVARAAKAKGHFIVGHVPHQRTMATSNVIVSFFIFFIVSF
jgi:hypothetical protein